MRVEIAMSCFDYILAAITEFDVIINYALLKNA